MRETQELYLDTIANEVDSFMVFFPEPTGITMFIENDTSRMLNFYISPGRLEIYIDAAHTCQSKFINSSINDQYFNDRRRRDSITNMVYCKEIRDFLKKTNPLSAARDSIRKIFNTHYNNLQKVFYRECLSQPKSFLSLESLNFWLQDMLLKKEKAIFSKQQLQVLFKKLDKRSMKNYPTYKDCRRLLKMKSNSLPSINEPLYIKQ